MNPAAEIARLRAAIEERDETIRQLKAMVADEAIVIPAGWRLTRTEARIFRLLARRETAQLDLLLDALWGDNLDIDDPERTLRVHVSRLRRKLRTTGLDVRSDRGLGYSLTGRHKLKELCLC